MRNILKIAKWEIKRNATNKTFLISIILTPVLMVLFSIVPALLGSLEESKPVTVYVVDEIGVFQSLEAGIDKDRVAVALSSKSPSLLREAIKGKKNEAFVVLDSGVLQNKTIQIYTGTDSSRAMDILNRTLQTVLRDYKLKSFGVSDLDLADLNTPFAFHADPVEGQKESNPAKFIPAVFAAFLLIAIFITGTMTFYSSLQDKKDKMVEILLSSIRAEELMQGKIIGYFVLGLMQVGVWMAFGIPAAQMYFKIPVVKYLFVPELLPMMFFALGGYLMYSAVFVALGATMEDVQSATNFQSTIMILPMIPFFLIAPIMSDPSGMVARVGTYFPLTTPGVMLLRLSISQHMPVWELLLSGAVMLLAILGISKLAGKIFKAAILMYDKNASAKQVLDWVKEDMPV